MPSLTNLDREKLNALAEEGNEDAITFLGQTEQLQKRNYYRGWKILADQGDFQPVERLERDKARLGTNHEKTVAAIQAGVDDGDSTALALRDKRREDVRIRQQNSRARRKANQPTTMKKRKAAGVDVAETVEIFETGGRPNTARTACEMDGMGHVQRSDG